jgi:hypothetical protein
MSVPILFSNWCGRKLQLCIFKKLNAIRRIKSPHEVEMFHSKGIVKPIRPMFSQHANYALLILWDSIVLIIHSSVNLWAVYVYLDQLWWGLLRRWIWCCSWEPVIWTSNSKRILVVGRWYISKVSVLKIFQAILGPATLIVPLFSLLYVTISCENILD